MCVAVEYQQNEETIYATAGEYNSRLPVKLRNGHVRTYAWGAHGQSFYDEPRSIRTEWPKEPWVPLQAIKSGAWAEFDPKPVQIAAIRFLAFRELDDAGPLDYWITLKPREYLQGALIRHRAACAIYIVTVEPPQNFGIASPWPRIVRAAGDTRPQRAKAL